MFRTAKAMMVAGMIAAGLPLLTEKASSQTPNTWNYVTPYGCSMENVPDDSGQTVGRLHIHTLQGFHFDVFESEIISTLVKSCDEMRSFYLFYRPGQAWQTEFYFSSFSAVTGDPLTAGMNHVKPLYCTSQQQVDDPVGFPQPHTMLWVVTQYYGFGVYDSRAIAAIARICWEGGGFYGEANGLYWDYFQFYPEPQ